MQPPNFAGAVSRPRCVFQAAAADFNAQDVDCECRLKCSRAAFAPAGGSQRLRGFALANKHYPQS
eukprot:14230341-Alexandrium_andersonii.AAC.1